MSDDLVPQGPALLRREALLPAERNRGLGTIAVVCTMAGVASGLALATTLMAMQVADTMSGPRAYHHHHVRGDCSPHGFLGIGYAWANGAINVTSTVAESPAVLAGIETGDRVIAVDGDRVDSEDEMHDVIFGARPGSHPVILIERAGAIRTVQPTLASLIVER